VERFSNLETGQSATIDAPLALALIAEAAARVTPGATSLLDVVWVAKIPSRRDWSQSAKLQGHRCGEKWILARRDEMP
jgi:hypothetical protein